jgi:DNA-binding CsgD family transcriptional regulator
VSGDLIGRNDELQVVERFLDDSAAGLSALLIEGEAGIGKTALWRAALHAAAARDYRMLTTRPGEVDAKIALSALGDLLDDVAGEVLAALPQPQRRALEVALLIEEPHAEPTDERAVAVGVLGALRSLAERGRLLIAVDDVQWLDPASAGALRFAARRLDAGHVRFLLAHRTDGLSQVPLDLDRALLPGRLQSLQLDPLSLGATQRLLDQHLETAFSRPVLHRLHELSGGNPFFALELGRALERGTIRLTPGERLPAALDVLVRDRLAALPSGTRRALATAAAVSQPTTRLLAVVAPGALEPAIAAQVVELDGESIRFTHPLLAAAALASVAPSERRAIHRRLAESSDDLEERARHLAYSSEQPDSEVAGLLEDAAVRAHARGAPAAAAEFAGQALELTPNADSADVPRRKLQGAEYFFEAGESRQARELLEGLIASLPAGSQRARALGRLARMSNYIASPDVAADLYLRALAEAEDDVRLRAEAEEGLAWSLVLLRQDLAAAEVHARNAAEVAEGAGDFSLLAEALTARAVAAFYLGHGTPTELMKPALALEPHTEHRPGNRQPRWALGALLMLTDELDVAWANLEAVRSRADDRAEESFLPLILSRLSYCEWLTGKWEAALRHATEAYEAALRTDHQTQRAIALSAMALAQAHLGRAEPARAAAEECLALSDRAVGSTAALGALGFLELSLGNAAATYGHLEAVMARVSPAAIGEPGELRFAPDAIEALLALGRPDEAKRLTDRLEQQGQALRSPSARAAALRCRGLHAAVAGESEDALAHFERALAAHEQVPIPFDRARTLLAYGAAQRRAKRRRDARTSLEAALDSFERLGARLWAEQARAELARIGGRAPAAGELTPTERQVAEYVAEGLQTKQVARALFVSPKTIEGHLSNIYAKLGVHSRTELANRLNAQKAE